MTSIEGNKETLVHSIGNLPLFVHTTLKQATILAQSFARKGAQCIAGIPVQVESLS